MLAYALRKQEVKEDIVCMYTEDITPNAQFALNLLFDYTVLVEKIYIPHKRRQKRQDRPFMFTRLNALRLGQDGDLDYDYTKIVLLDADVLPIKNYSDLFKLKTPAGIINEDKSHFVNTGEHNKLLKGDKWIWHEVYDKFCPHGHKIPKEFTDRVKTDFSNMGINGSLFVIRPSMHEFKEIMRDIEKPEIKKLVCDLFDWPDMQYLAMKWSGKWYSVDIKYSGFNGYPNLTVLNGTHFAGIKPWYLKKNPRMMKRCSRFEDFKYWFKKYNGMLIEYPKLKTVEKLRTLLRDIRQISMDSFQSTKA